ncbi:adenine phosphoribosyltransferase-like isoform X1 [Ptychodera flava]|uniref:adenine phosphoribosyltransferase-like isoform X1 n=1 Tax=Ptychodera flava TaxID=63121 RepID=UPI00396A5023
MSEKRDKHWYLSLMAPNQKGPGFAWLDPSRLYANQKAFRDCVTHLIQPYDPNEIDLVVGIDGAGFILGASVATRLNKGFLTIRKEHCLCVKTFSEKYQHHSGGEKVLEIRQDAFPEGTRLLIVDQWIETGGTMQASINLLERLGGKVQGIAVIAIESNTHKLTKEITEKYKCTHLVPSEMQPEVDKQYFESFKKFEEGKADFAYFK